MNTDSQLIAEYVKLTRKLTQAEAGLRIGVSQKTISEWRAGRGRSLQPRTRAALEAYLHEPEITGDPGARSPGGDVARQIDEVNSLDEDGGIKAWLIAEIASAYRSSAIDQLAVALRIAEESSSLRGQYFMSGMTEFTRSRKVAEARPEDDLGQGTTRADDKK